MTDQELQPFVGKRVALTLLDGEVLVGVLRSTEARLVGAGDYAIESPQPAHGSAYRGVRYCQLVSAIRELPTFRHWCQAIGDLVRQRLEYIDLTIAEERASAGFGYAGTLVGLHANSELEATLIAPLARGGALTEGVHVPRGQPISRRCFAIDHGTVREVATAIVALLDPNAEHTA